MKTKVINYRTVCRVMGWMLLLEAAMLILPTLVSISYGENDYKVFLAAIGCCMVPGLLLAQPGSGFNTDVTRRESYLLTGLCWVLFSAFGMLPLIWSPTCSLGVADAFFETMSGFTTTGATVIADVDRCSKGVLFWRSEIQWFGGLGIILFTLALLPALNKTDGIWMFNTETTGITHDKTHPRIGHTAKTLWMVYSMITILCILALWAGPMDLFDSVCTSMSCVSTGGFSPHSAGLDYWDSAYINGTMTIFMFVSGINFIILYRVARGDRKSLTGNDVFRCYCMILGVSYMITLLSLLISGEPRSLRNLLIDPLCQTVSAFTSTGVSSMPYEIMRPSVVAVLTLLMGIGACAGSTSGGLKTDRLLVICKNARNESRRILYPNRMNAIHVNGTYLSDGILIKIFAFLACYLFLWLATTVITTMYGFPVFDSAFAVLSCLSNNGLGYGITGSEGSFSVFPDLVKWLMSGVMLAGRLEIFTIIVLFIPRFWRG